MILNKQYNKYDYIILLLLASLAAGGIGQGLQPVRILTIINIPLLISSYRICKNRNVKLIVRFFAFWMIYNTISLIWTSDLSNAMKEMIYYPIHMCIFLEIIIFSYRANKPIQSILYGWSLAILLTIPVALFEIFTDVHLASSVFDSDKSVNVDGVRMQKLFAATTFANYNAYETFLCLASPFLFGLIVSCKTIVKLLFSYIILISVFYISLVNASRGAIFALSIMTILFILYQRKNNTLYGRVIFMIMVISILLIIIYNGEKIFQQFLYRFAVKDNLMEDDARLSLIIKSLNAYVDSFYIGNGIGSSHSALFPYGTTLPPHNLILELLVQFGLVITSFVLYFIYTLYRKSKEKKLSTNTRLVLRIAVFSLIFVSVINSAYLTMPSLWCYFASLQVLSVIGLKNIK